jgi:hypothetical protein
MTSIERITHPSLPESYRSENAINLAVIGIVTNTKDPRGLNRIKCRVDLIDQYNDLPHGDDGWIPTVTRFTVPFGEGGSKEPIKEGSEVLLLPIFGRSNNWVYLGCIPNAVDKPSPEFTSREGLYGEVTEGGIVTLKDELDNSEIKAFPQGVSQIVTGTGDSIFQTQGGAKQTLTQDGNVIHETPNAAIAISPTGRIQQGNKVGSQLVLDESGNVSLKDAGSAELSFTSSQVTLSSSFGGIARQIDGIKKSLSGYLQQGNQLLSEVSDTLQSLNIDGLDAGLGDLTATLQKLSSGIGTTIESGLEQINALSNAPLKDFTDQLDNSIQSAYQTGIGVISSSIKEIIQPGNAKELLGELTKIVPPEWGLGAITQEVIDALSYSPEVLLEYILKEIAPEGIDYGLLNLGIYEAIAPLDKAIAEAKAILLDPEPNFLSDFGEEYSDSYFGDETLNIFTPEEIARRKALRRSLVRNALPELLKAQSTDEWLDYFIEEDKNIALSTLTGLAQQSIAKSGQEALSSANTLLQQTPLFSELTASYGQADFDRVKEIIPQINPDFDLSDYTNPQTVLPQLLSPFVSKLQPLINDSASKVQSLLKRVNGISKGAQLVLKPYLAEMRASPVLPSGKLQVNAGGGFLASASGLNTVFANPGGAGAATPWGGFSIGAGGGNFLTQGLLALSTFQQLGKSAGLLINSTDGAGLASFSHDEDDPDIKIKTAEITTDGSNARIIATNSILISLASGLWSGILITDEGTWVDNILLNQYLYWLRDENVYLRSLIDTINISIASIISSGTGGGGSSPESSDAVTEGSVNLYFTQARVLATLLTGYSASSPAAIAATDTILQAFGKIQALLDEKQTSFGYAAEDVANKSTSSSLGTSDTLYPSQKAVKNYVDAELSSKQTSLGFTPEDTVNKSTSNSLGTSNTLYPSQGAVKSYVDTALTGKQNSLGFTPESTANKNQPNGYAGLDSSGLIPSSRLPSYVDDVLEYANLATFPAVGATEKIYTALDANRIYRWSGSTYVEISPSPGSTDVVAEGSGNLYFTFNRVLNTLLTGLSTVSSGAISATDSILAALGKLQNSKQNTIAGAATTITDNNLAATRALASDANGKVGISSTTLAELNYLSGVTSAIQDQLNSKTGGGGLAATTQQTASYTLALGDVDSLIQMNVSTVNSLTVPPDSSVSFPLKTQILISQHGTGQTTIAPGAGVTLRSDSGRLKLSSQYAGATLIKIATNEWYVFGNLVNDTDTDSTVQAQLDSKTDKLVRITRQTASYTLALIDADSLVEMNVAGANTLTVPPDSSVAFPIRTQLLISQYGTGQTTVTAGAGVTLRSDAGRLKLSSQYSGATLIKIAADEWYVFGSLTT